MSKKIFISHSSLDCKLVEIIASFIAELFGISRDEIFCTSIDGADIKNGERIVRQIKEEIQSPAIFLAVITTGYIKSQFCLCEIGAAWAMAHQNIFVRTPDVDIKRLVAIISGSQINDISCNETLGKIADKIKNVLHKDYTGDSFQSISRKFSEKIKHELKKDLYLKFDGDSPSVAEEIKIFDRGFKDVVIPSNSARRNGAAKLLFIDICENLFSRSILNFLEITTNRVEILLTRNIQIQAMRSVAVNYDTVERYLSNCNVHSEEFLKKYAGRDNFVMRSYNRYPFGLYLEVGGSIWFTPLWNTRVPETAAYQSVVQVKVHSKLGKQLSNNFLEIWNDNNTMRCVYSAKDSA